MLVAVSCVACCKHSCAIRGQSAAVKKVGRSDQAYARGCWQSIAASAASHRPVRKAAARIVGDTHTYICCCGQAYNRNDSGSNFACVYRVMSTSRVFQLTHVFTHFNFLIFGRCEVQNCKDQKFQRGSRPRHEEGSRQEWH